MNVDAMPPILFQRLRKAIPAKVGWPAKFGFRNRPDDFSNRVHAGPMSIAAAGKQCRNVELKPGEVMSLTRPGSIRIIQGVVWVTGTPAEGDMILIPGKTFSLKKGLPFVIEGLTAARLMVFTD